MRNIIYSILGIVFSIAMFACSKTGPAGPAGVDANANCTQCHNVSTEIKARIDQYAMSTHATGGHAGRGTSASCARCHANEGFIDYVNGKTAVAIADPTQPGCRTCHLIHTTYTSGDLALRTSAAVTLDTTSNVFDHGKGNLCVRCHQSRSVTPMPVPGAATNYTISTANALRYGPHHGPQGNLLTGYGGYESPTKSWTSLRSHQHQSVTDACVTCHMQPYKSQSAADGAAGGHTWNMEFDYSGTTYYMTNACNTCHGGATEKTFDHGGLQTQVETLFGTLSNMLVSSNLVNSNSGAPTNLTSLDPDTLGAVYNYMLIKEDRSWGVHNPTYIFNLLEGSITDLTN